MILPDDGEWGAQLGAVSSVSCCLDALAVIFEKMPPFFESPPCLEDSLEISPIAIENKRLESSEIVKPPSPTLEGFYTTW